MNGINWLEIIGWSIWYPCLLLFILGSIVFALNGWISFLKEIWKKT